MVQRDERGQPATVDAQFAEGSIPLSGPNVIGPTSIGGEDGGGTRIQWLASVGWTERTW